MIIETSNLHKSVDFVVFEYENWNSCWSPRREPSVPKGPREPDFLATGRPTVTPVYPAAGSGGGVATQVADL